MFKKILLVLSLAIPLSATAQIGPGFQELPKNVICGPLEVIMKGLADPDINEAPIWIGKDESNKSEYMLFVNKKTKAFTIVQFGRTTGCILGIGYNSNLIIEQQKL